MFSIENLILLKSLLENGIYNICKSNAESDNKFRIHYILLVLNDKYFHILLVHFLTELNFTILYGRIKYCAYINKIT